MLKKKKNHQLLRNECISKVIKETEDETSEFGPSEALFESESIAGRATLFEKEARTPSTVIWGMQDIHN